MAKTKTSQVDSDQQPEPTSNSLPDSSYKLYDLAIPEALEVGPDPLRIRLDFHNQMTIMHLFEGEGLAAVQTVDPRDVSRALASELSVGTGLLPRNTLWWNNTKVGEIFALYEEPKVWKLALQEKPQEPPRRFTCPMPGFIFLCTRGQTPWVFAVKRRPSRLSDVVYEAPLANLFRNGRTCSGSHKFPADVSKIPDSFFRSFFSREADLSNRSRMFPQNVINLWEFLDGKRKFPMEDLVKLGTVKDLITMDLTERW